MSNRWRTLIYIITDHLNDKLIAGLMINISDIGTKQIKVYSSSFACSLSIKVDMALCILNLKHIIQSFMLINSPHV